MPTSSVRVNSKGRQARRQPGGMESSPAPRFVEILLFGEPASYR
jgi:hypothetical protein